MNRTLLLTCLDGTRVIVARPFHTEAIPPTPNCPTPPTGTRLMLGMSKPDHIDVRETVEQIAFSLMAVDVAADEPERLRYAERAADRATR